MIFDLALVSWLGEAEGAADDSDWGRRVSESVRILRAFEAKIQAASREPYDDALFEWPDE